jgi:hypothetical protein
MGDIRVTLGIAACLAVFAVGCASSGQVGQVQETGLGTYSIGVRPSHGLGASSQENKAMDAAVDKAGQYCHAKGEALGDHGGRQHHQFSLPLGQRSRTTLKMPVNMPFSPPVCCLEAGNKSAEAALFTCPWLYCDSSPRHATQA